MATKHDQKHRFAIKKHPTINPIGQIQTSLYIKLKQENDHRQTQTSSTHKPKEDIHIPARGGIQINQSQKETGYSSAGNDLNVISSRMARDQFTMMRFTLAALALIHGATAYSMSANELEVTYQCFERKTKKPVAASSVDLSTEEISCELITPEKNSQPTEETDKNISTPENPPENEEASALKTTINFEKQAWEPLATQTQEQVNAYPRNFPLAARRAINLARGSVVTFNGGLRIYRPGSCMFTSAVNNPCLIHASRDGFQFLVPGGTPGWEQSNAQPETKTRVWISGDGRTLLNASSAN